MARAKGTGLISTQKNRPDRFLNPALAEIIISQPESNPQSAPFWVLS
jgi:hypothetical protein